MLDGSTGSTKSCSWILARSVFWQQASSVRSSLQELKAERPELALELETVSKKLDTSSFSGLSTSNNEPQLYERRLGDHRGLVLKRESLIKEIRLLPGFEFFLKPTPFNRLRDAAAAGRVVIVNISKLGTDALVFDSINPIIHVPLSTIAVAQLLKHNGDIGLKQTGADDIQDQEPSLTLPEVLDSIDVDTLKPKEETDLTPSDDPVQRQARADVTDDHQNSRTLPRVWQRILKPILTAVGIPLQPIHDGVPARRIFWYLTGPLTFTPIHAAEHVSQLVVSSYVTTLSSLAEAQKRQSEAISGPPMLLAISQPDTPGQSRIPHAAEEVNMVMRTASAAGWPEGRLQRFDRAQATINEVSTALNSCSWVHFACHAMQHVNDGMESAFALHDGRLKLSVIAAKRLPSARFAFLSTCQSASGLEDSPGEAMHLSAGMQFAGFSSVIATMWSIQDEDAPIIAKHTYAYLLRNGVGNIDLTEGAAALNHAVSQLRQDPNVTMERWALFVYYGV
ncbi:hypothetical protein FIBSPDRAFT_1043674 [Athelia psychrophila]|uniref:CHAT domain-containing protein n=1 Tax=Athelia psychrophila TaxID=1759441 RepID=A0A166KRW0_9AGAM|nr:hypothetical protein FIBSPDRAFT_1043674 [Fibularhizoctonia sp. CBS 109695]